MASSIFIPDIVEENLSGIFATNPIRATLPVLLAPTTEARETASNRIRQELIVVACANLKESNFAFDSSVIAPDAQRGFIALAALLTRHVDCPMTIFGHSDPTGARHYNHFLSERRARAVFAVMVRDVSIWEKLFSDAEGATGDVWGVRGLQTMLAAFNEDLAPTNKFDDDTKTAIRALLALAPGATVVNDAKTRALIFGRYMDFLRGAPTLSPPFPSLTPNDFLGRGKQKATLQGCSAFNPQLLFSRSQQTSFDANPSDELKQVRDAANEPNRRVVIYLFQQGTLIDPALWPCPSAAQGEAACLDRQWSNGKDRRSTLFDEHRRRFGRAVADDKRVITPPNAALAAEIGQEETTFGCRFYHGIALYSPCERDLRLWGIQLLTDAPTLTTPGGATSEVTKVPIANKRFVAVVGTTKDAPVIRGRTSDQGMLALPLFDPDVPILLKLDAFDVLTPATPPTPDPIAPASDSLPTVETDRFDDEAQFMQIRLAAGALKPIQKRDGSAQFFDDDFDSETVDPVGDELEIAAMQRLYNLGFGSDDTGGATFGNWVATDRVRFLQDFQREKKLPPSGRVDPATVKALFEAHGS